MTQLVPAGKIQFIDINGKPLVGGKVFFYEVNTNTPKDTWQDFPATVLNINPVILDARGQASIYGTGAYRQVVQDATGVQISDQIIPDLLKAVTDATAFLNANSTIEVPNIAALRLLDSSIYKNAFATGYYVKGDEGGGKYWFDSADISSADNGGTIIVGLAGARWKYKGVVTVNTFGAKGDGVTSDIAAFTATANNNAGVVRLLAKTYNINGWLMTASTIQIIGAAKPSFDTGRTKLQDGSILLGHFETRSFFATAKDFGVDAGTARGFGSTVGGFTMDAQSGTNGIELIVDNIVVLASSNTGADSVHGLLAEGWDKATITRVDFGIVYHGVVYKGRRGFISKIRAYRPGADVVFVKSDTPASGGFVADATVQNVIVDDVYGECDTGNAECNHVYVLASTAILSTVHVTNVIGVFGNAPLRIAGGSALLYASGCTFTNITGIGTSTGVDIFGTTFDIVGSNIHADNPKTGKAVITSGASSNWNITGILLALTDASIGGIYCADFFGTGSWDNFTVRSGIGRRRINFLPDQVICGQKRGEVDIEGEGGLSLGGNWAAGAPAPRLDILPGNVMRLTGVVSSVVATGNSVAALPGGGTNVENFILHGQTAASAYIPVYMNITGNSLTLSSPTFSGVRLIDLSGISYKR
jgi:hypothetical protein